MSQGSICSHLGSEIEDKWLCAWRGEKTHSVGMLLSLHEWQQAHDLQHKLSIISLLFNLQIDFIFHRLEASFFFFPCSICSVQKLSEFFSSDEIGDEQEPRTMLTSGSSNHNQNRYQAVVSICAYTLFFFLMCVCWQQRRQRFFSLSPLLVHPGCLTLLCECCFLSPPLSSSCYYHHLPFCLSRAWRCAIVL